MKRTGASDLIEVDAECIHETEKAYLLAVGGIKEWVPKSMCEENDDGTFTMPERIALEKGLI